MKQQVSQKFIAHTFVFVRIRKANRHQQSYGNTCDVSCWCKRKKIIIFKRFTGEFLRARSRDRRAHIVNDPFGGADRRVAGRRMLMKIWLNSLFVVTIWRMSSNLYNWMIMKVLFEGFFSRRSSLFFMCERKMRFLIRMIKRFPWNVITLSTLLTWALVGKMLLTHAT